MRTPTVQEPRVGRQQFRRRDDPAAHSGNMDCSAAHGPDHLGLCFKPFAGRQVLVGMTDWGIDYTFDCTGHTEVPSPVPSTHTHTHTLCVCLA